MGRRPRCFAQGWAAAIAVLVLWGGGSAQAAPITKVFSTGIPCQKPTSDTSDAVRQCEGSASTLSQTDPSGNVTGEVVNPAGTDTRVPSFDGTPLDVNVTLPAAPSSGTDGHYPLVIIGHGWGGSKLSFDEGAPKPRAPNPHDWAKMGYAVLTVSDRGFADSCGQPASRAPNPSNPGNAQPCNQQGWIRLMDTRYEVRDVQYLAGLLVDAGVVDPQRIGATGGSYGGGLSLMLATLKDRIMCGGSETQTFKPCVGHNSGDLIPWTSPNLQPMKIAAAAPEIPWTDLVYSLVPNGRTLDYTITGPTDDFAPPDSSGKPNFADAGIEKQSFVSGLFASAPPGGYYAPPGADAEHDLTRWFADTSAGEPYDQNPDFAGTVVPAFVKYRSPYYLLGGAPYGASPNTEPPAPLFMSNGFTDDLFPVDETVRYYNLEKTLYPNNPASLMYLDYGHMRGQNKGADISALASKEVAWFNHYVRGDAADPGQEVRALTQTCPSSAASGGPFVSPTWVGLHPGILLNNAGSAAQTVLSTGGNPTTSATVDPIAAGQAGTNACATTPDQDDPSGVTATYRLPKVVGDGYTMLGAPIIVANLSVSGQFPELAMRLWDDDPSKSTQTLVARGLYRPDPSTPASQLQVLELHPGAWHFAAGHIPKLELLGRDVPYARASNGPFQIMVSNVFIGLPTHETSGNGIVPFGALPAPPGARAAPGVQLTSPTNFANRLAPACSKLRSVRVRLKGARKRRVRSVSIFINGKRQRVVRGRRGSVRVNLAGHTGKVSLRLVVRRTRGKKITIRRTYTLCQSTATTKGKKRTRHRGTRRRGA